MPSFRKEIMIDRRTRTGRRLVGSKVRLEPINNTMSHPPQRREFQLPALTPSCQLTPAARIRVHRCPSVANSVSFSRRPPQSRSKPHAAPSLIGVHRRLIFSAFFSATQRLGALLLAPAPHARRRISARASSSADRARSASRLSCNFFPFATASSHLIRPFFK